MSSFLTRYRTIVLTSFGVLVFLSMPFTLSQNFLTTMITFFVYACLGLGWNVIMGYAGQLSLMQPLFIGAGALTPALLFKYFGISPWIGMWAGALISVVASIFIGYLCFRYNVKGVFFALVSLAFSQIALAFTITFIPGAHELFWPVTNSIKDFQFKGNTAFYYIGFFMLGGMISFMAFLIKTRTGYYLLALRENEDAAQALGIEARKYKIIALALSALLTSITGTFYVQYLGTAISSELMGLSLLIVLILVTLVGGLGTVFGPVIGACFVVLLSAFSRNYLPMIPGLNVTVYGFCIILVILYMPEGILPMLSRRLSRVKNRAWQGQGKYEIPLSTVLNSSFFWKPESPTSLLLIQGLTKRLGGLMAVNDFSLEVKSGEIVGLIGPNGAGKTTVFNLCTGFLTPTEGKMLFDGKSLTGKRPDQISRYGLGRTFQVAKPFSSLSVIENVMLGVFSHRAQVSSARKEAMDILKLMGLGDRSHLPAKALTLGEQRQLEIARILATRPKLILLDEAMAGLRPNEIDQAIELIRKLREAGIAFLIVEHIIPIILTLADRIIVMDFGKKIAEDIPEQIVKNKKVIESYLGEERINA